MSVTAYPTLRLKLTMPQALKLQFLPAIPGSNAAAAAAAAQAAAAEAIAAANTAVSATANKVDRTGDVMTGFLTLNADPTASLHAATKHYVDILGTSGILEAPNDGVLYGRQSLAWAAAQPLDGDLTSLAGASATNAIYYRSAANTWATVTIGANLTFIGGTLAATGGGGGGGAPTTAEYITSAADATLSAERVLTNTASITWDFSTPGQAKANTAAGGGNVSNSGTPTAGQYGKWVTATTIQGVAVGTVLVDIGAQPLDATLTSLAAYNTNGLLTQTAADTFTGRTLTGPAAGIAVTNGNGVSGNPTLALSNDLAALEALAGTNNIYYRAGADTWTAITIGTGLTFTGGTLAASASGGNVSNSGTPVSGQLAQWTDATHIQGVDASTFVFNCGQLEFISTTALSFKPYNGDRIKINGVIYAIPSAGIAGLANTSVFVNGVAGQNLAANTVYWVYAFNNSGTITADFVTGSSHAPSSTAGNVGVEIKSGDNTRTLIGMVRTNNATPGIFTSDPGYNGVISWFNRRNLQLLALTTAGATTSSTGAAVELSTGARCYFCSWAEEAILCGVYGNARNNTAGSYVNIQVYLDGVSMAISGAGVSAAASADIPAAGFAAISAADGFHFLTPMGSVSAGTGTYYVIATGMIRG